jgi:hypothetical protein
METRLSERADVLTPRRERLDSMRTWLMVLTWLVGAPFAALVVLAALLARR